MSIHDDLKALGFKDLGYLMNPGIYVMTLNGEVVYVGQTINAFGRFDKPDHRARTYDKVYFIKCPLVELDRVEALMILKLKPKSGAAYNFNKNTDPRNKPVEHVPGEGSFTINVKGVELTAPFRRRL